MRRHPPRSPASLGYTITVITEESAGPQRSTLHTPTTALPLQIPTLLYSLTVPPITTALRIAILIGLASAPQLHHKPKSTQPAITEPDLVFDGEIERGKTYVHDIGHDLQFLLDIASEGDYAGWEISITPKTQPSDGPIEFSGNRHAALSQFQ